MTALTAFVSCKRTRTDRKPTFPTIEVYAVGIREPRVVPAAEVKIPDHKTVIGVRVGDESRAYLVDAFKPRGLVLRGDGPPQNVAELGKHVVNDVLGGRPITVTHCDLNGCSRVFTNDGSTSLDVAVAGAHDGQMELLLLRQKFLQNATDAPLPDYEFEIATWKEWSNSNPDTELYLGDIPNVDVNEETQNARPAAIPN